jgi:hypothetical protein
MALQYCDKLGNCHKHCTLTYMKLYRSDGSFGLPFVVSLQDPLLKYTGVKNE